MDDFVAFRLNDKKGIWVRRDSLARHPGTLLGMLVTNTSTAEYELMMAGKPIPLEVCRPGLFFYVLKYYLEGLPITIDDDDVRKPDLVNELKYFNIDVTEDDLVKPPMSVEKRVAQNLAYALIAAAGRDSHREVFVSVNPKIYFEGACDMVGDEANYLKARSGNQGILSQLLGLAKCVMCPQESEYDYSFQFVNSERMTIRTKKL